MPLVAPGVLPADSGEFQLVVRDLGVAHPPGYPLYILSAHLFGRLVLATPLPQWWARTQSWSTGEPSERLVEAAPQLAEAPGTPGTDRPTPGTPGTDRPTPGGYDAWAWSVNLYSAFLAALTLAIVFLIASELAGSSAGLLAVLALLSAPTFLSQTSVANIRLPAALLTAAVLRAAQVASQRQAVSGSLRRSRPAALDGVTVRLAGCLGLAVGHHPSLLVLLPPAAALVAWRGHSGRRQARTLLFAAAAFLIGLLPILYLPWRDRAAAPLAPGNLSSWRGLLQHATGYGFRGDVLSAAASVTLLDRAAAVAQILRLQFGWLGLGLAGAGLLGLSAGLLRPGQQARGPIAEAGVANSAPLQHAGALTRGRPEGASVPVRPWRTPLTSQQALGLMLATTAGLVACLAVAYRAPQTAEYLMPAYVALAIASGLGPAALLAALCTMPGLRALPAATTSARLLPWPAGRGVAWPAHLAGILESALALLCGLAFATGGLRWAEAIRRQPAASEVARALSVLDSLAVLPNTTLLANWHYATPLWYAARHLAQRSDVQVEYVHPRGAEPLGETLRRLATSRPGPVLLSHRSAELLAADVPLWPVAPAPFSALFPVAPLPGGQATSRPGQLVASAANPGVWQLRYRQPPVLGGRLRLTALDLAATADAGLEVYVWFDRLVEITEPLTIVAQLRDERGQVWAQADQGHSAARWNHPAGLAGRLQLVPFRRPPAPHQGLRLTVGVYRQGSRGPERLALTSWGDAPISGQPAPPTADAAVQVELPAALLAALTDAASPAPPPQAVPFGQAMTLLSWRMQRRPDQLVVDLQWRADRALSHDYTVSVQVRGNGWSAQHDGTPALGCLPTLKWLPGMTIWDRHRVELPAEALAADEDRPTVTVAVYDAFSLTPLPVTDAERVRQGQGQYVQLASAPQW